MKRQVSVEFDSGVQGRVMLDKCVPTRKNLSAKPHQRKFVAANCEQIRGLGKETIPLQTKMRRFTDA